MWKEQVAHISKIREERSRKLNVPATGNELSRFRNAVVEKFGEDVLPQQYYEFLQTVNGIEFNGLKIYGIDLFLLDSEPINQVDSFFDANETWEWILFLILMRCLNQLSQPYLAKVRILHFCYG